MKLSDLADPPCDLEYIRLRCRMEGDCWVWSLSTKEGRWPRMSVTRPDKKGVARQFCLYVRHVVVWLSRGGRPRLGNNRAVITTCGNPMCVNPAHLKVISKAELNRINAGYQGTLSMRKKYAESRRRTSRLSDDDVKTIRESDKAAKEVAQEYGISLAYVYMLRRGEWRREYTSNPFAGLLAANDSKRRAA